MIVNDVAGGMDGIAYMLTVNNHLKSLVIGVKNGIGKGVLKL